MILSIAHSPGGHQDPRRIDRREVAHVIELAQGGILLGRTVDGWMTDHIRAEWHAEARDLGGHKKWNVNKAQLTTGV